MSDPTKKFCLRIKTHLYQTSCRVVRYVFIMIVFFGGCDRIDQDLDATLADFAGPDATDCGEAICVTNEEAEDVRACIADALETEQPFVATAGFCSYDGSITIGWASDGQTLWYVVYKLVAGCSPVWHDSMETYECTSIQDYGDGCESSVDDNDSILCYRCNTTD